MKTMNYIVLFVAFLSVTACIKKTDEIILNPDVEQYIELLKSNQYDSLNLPAFSYNDIPALLKYRNENQIITDFPHNPISSFYGPECILGTYVLWTIESIRAVDVNSQYLIMRFPSLNPVLGYKNTVNKELFSEESAHKIAAKAYYDWWYDNKNKEFENFKNIDPLLNTDYKWQ